MHRKILKTRNANYSQVDYLQYVVHFNSIILCVNPKKGDGVRDGDRVGGMGEHVKKAHKTDKTTGVPGRIETTVLTTANVARFFAPTYKAPRSKEQRKANPRPSVM